MSDGTVGVLQSTSPDRLIDNTATTVAALTVYRQRIESFVETVNETRADYGARTDTQPVYVGRSPNGAATSAAAWTVWKFTYDGSDRMTRSQVLSAVAWDDRAAAAW